MDQNVYTIIDGAAAAQDEDICYVIDAGNEAEWSEDICYVIED
ncbi:hypothetical protein [Burkholderia vietnamiensis]|nr:hypothetical protein [Burkholderia vietnamiensis]